jgi:hypothetical protein
MPIITIYQGASGEGQELAESVAGALGYRCVGREVLLEASRQYGIPEAKLNEIVEKGPHWWELLPGIEHVLKVLLTAPIEHRIEQIRTRQNLTDSAARHYLEEIDKARSRRLMAMFGTDWRDPNRYDLVLNMGKMRREGAGRVIIEAARLEEYQPTTASDQAFKDFALASRVQASLFAAPNIRLSGVEVRAEGGHLYLRGRVDQGLEEEVVKLVKNVPGVIKVASDLYSAPPEGFLEP